jgi:uncharacterized protein involved in cysteine biosynthesis
MLAVATILNIVVIFGTVCVLVTFGFMIPVVSKVLIGLFSVVMGDQAVAKIRGKSGGTELIDHG